MGAKSAYLSTMRLSFAIGLMALASINYSQETNQTGATGSVAGHMMAAPPNIDGTIDEVAEWKDVPSFEGLVDANTSAPAPESGKFWLAYDQKFIYFAARLFDSQPNQISATEYRTNVSLQGNDSISLIVDSFGTLSDFNIFSMNPRGATNIRIAGGRAAKREWLGDIQSKGRITETGWEVEARIPWSVMRLPGAGPRDLRFNVFRYLRRLQREYSWKMMQGGGIQNTPTWTQVTLPAGPPKTIKLLPYTYLGYDKADELIFNSGLDLKTSLTDQLEFVGTINPDFRNIENDILSLDFSYFERIAGESRPFFLEGGQHFRTSNDAPIFLSQRIEDFDAGVKVYGKLDDKTDLAVLDTADFGEHNALVFNARRQFTPKSSFRIAYSGLDSDEFDIQNRAIHTEFRQGWGAWDSFFQFASTDDKQDGQGLRHNAGVVYEHGGLNGVFEYSSVTSMFNPRLGFAPQRGFEGLSGSLGIVRPFKSGKLLEDGYDIFVRRWNDFDGNTYLHESNLGVSLTGRDGTDLDIGVNLTEFGGFKDSVYYVSLEKPRGDAYRRWQIDYVWGDVEDKDFRLTAATLSYRPTAPLQLNASYQVLEHGGRNDQLIFSGNYDLGQDRSVSGRAVKTNDDWNAYLAFRRSGNTGIEYFLILGDPNAQRFRESLILKVVYPLELILGRK